MQAPHVKHDVIEDYIAFYCQDVLTTLAEKVTSQQTPSFIRDNLTVYTIPQSANKEALCLVVDQSRGAFQDFDKKVYDASPDAIKSYMTTRLYGTDGKYYLTSKRNTLGEIVRGLADYDSTIANELLSTVQSAYGNEQVLADALSSVTAKLPAIEAWVDKENQTLVYDGQEQEKTCYKLRPFIASYLNIFKMNGQLMLSHNGAAKSLVRRLVPGGEEWYMADSHFGSSIEYAAGSSDPELFDDDIEKNFFEHAQIKHIATPENCIVKIINGKQVAIAKEAEFLDFCITAIYEDLVKSRDISPDTTPAP